MKSPIGNEAIGIAYDINNMDNIIDNKDIIEESEQNYYGSETTPRDDNLQYNLRKTQETNH